MMYKITPIGHQAAESLIRWVAAVERLEELLLLPINEIAFYCEGGVPRGPIREDILHFG